MLTTLWKAMALGFSVAAPVGPIGLLCIRRTLADGRSVGLACGLGAATADALYGLVAGLGIAALSNALVGHNGILRWVGSGYLAFLGVRTFRAIPAIREANVRADVVWRVWGSTFLLTITNPTTIMSFAAMFSAIAGGSGTGLLQGPVLAAGVFLGSAAWWLILSTATDRLRSRFNAKHLVWINRTTGVLLLGFAIASVIPLVMHPSQPVG
jgi:threonine/homoserine/homoserine lactone efflux protein